MPRPEIEDIGGCVTVRFRSSSYVPRVQADQNISKRQRAILAILESVETGLPLREIHSRLKDGSEHQVREDLAILQTLGLANSVGHGRGANWKMQ